MTLEAGHYRGKPQMPLFTSKIWAQNLQNGQNLHVNESRSLQLDFGTFEPELADLTSKKLVDHYLQRKEKLMEYLKHKPPIDPCTFFLCFLVHRKVEKLLGVVRDEPVDHSEREKFLVKNPLPKLSDMKGRSMSPERAALGQYLCQRVNLKSAYIAGIRRDPKYNSFENHSFIMVKDPKQNPLIFDIADHEPVYYMPRIYHPDNPLAYEMFRTQNNFRTGASDALDYSSSEFGVGAQ